MSKLNLSWNLPCFGHSLLLLQAPYLKNMASEVSDAVPFDMDLMHYVDSYCRQLKSILLSMATQRRLHRQHEIAIKPPFRQPPKHQERPSTQQINHQSTVGSIFNSSTVGRLQTGRYSPTTSSISSYALSSSHLEDLMIDRSQTTLGQSCDIKSHQKGQSSISSTALNGSIVLLSKECIVSACVFAVSHKFH